MKRLAYIEFARGYAILSIVCFHVLQRLELPPLFQQGIVFGGTGVHLFFLLSGFGLCLGKPVSTGEFFKKRFSKVWLPYVLALTVSLGLAVSTGIFADRWPAWLAGAALYQMFFEQYIASFGGHFWFISAIFQFYIAFPFLLFLKNKLGAGRFFWLCLALSIGWWLAVFFLQKGGERVWNSFFLQFLWEFALGMVLSDGGRTSASGSTNQPEIHRPETVFSSASQSRIPNPQLPNPFWAAPSFWVYLPVGILFTGLMVLMILKLGPVGKIFNDVPALIGYASLSIFLFRFSEKWAPPVERFFRWVGGFSYSLYLVHVIVLELFLLFLKKTGLSLGSAWPVVFVGLALLGGWLFEPVSRAWVGLFEKKKAAASK